jgi:fructose specific-phosphotransferase system IIBC component
MALSNNFLLYLLAVVIGSIAAAFVLGFLKPAIKQEN